jgi:hypothetical protein
MTTNLTKEEMIAVILDWYKMYHFEWKENADAFGHLDQDTERAFVKMMVADDLITLLKMESDK